MSSLANLGESLKRYRATLEPSRHQQRRSAVTMLLHERSGEVEVLMIERATHEGDPWSGHMAFPGGRMDEADIHSYAAALRECSEEVGIDVEHYGHYLSRLSELPTHLRTGTSAMWVTPFVFALHREPPLHPNYEVADTIWVPLSFLADAGNRETMRWQRDDIDLELPCYWYQGKHIWGLSLGMLDELLVAVGLAHFPQPAR
ncbi:MAG: CoA pyrophosphatase [Pseudomonadales bacterium]